QSHHSDLALYRWLLPGGPVEAGRALLQGWLAGNCENNTNEKFSVRRAPSGLRSGPASGTDSSEPLPHVVAVEQLSLLRGKADPDRRVPAEHLEGAEL